MITFILQMLDYEIPIISINIIILVAIILILYLLNRNKNSNSFNKKFKVQEIKIGTKGTEYSIVPNHTVVQTAYMFWVELQTRKLGLPISLEHDVIVEIYNSWYTFFGVTRELIKQIPADELNDPNTQILIKMALEVLNDYIRPHLTKWQARFRKYYNEMLDKDENKDLSPQEIQENFQKGETYCYNQLTQELLEVNNILIEYKNNLEKLIFGEVLK